MEEPCKRSASGRGLALACLFLLAVTEAAAGTPGEKPNELRTLIVVSDNNYPPYVFRDMTGAVRGILPDQWALWERKTGVTVDFRPLDWAEAQRAIREGRADIIDTIFFTEERARHYDFSRPYARIEVPVFAHKTLGGISDIASLKGFTIGVKAGDAVIDHLARQGIDSLKEYPGYEALILAAKRHELKVFSVDSPPAVYLLYKHGIEDEFRQSFVLYTGEFHRAARKGRPDLLRLVQSGFDRISRGEYRAIERRWSGYPFLFKDIVRHWRNWILGGLGAVLALVLGNVLLGELVRAKTARLRTALGDLQRSLAAKDESEEALRVSREYFATLFNSINDALFVHDATTFRVLDVNECMLRMYGFASREEAIAAFNQMTGGTPPYAMEDARRWMHKACQEGPQLFEWLARHCDGHPFWVEVNIRRVRLGADDRLIVTVRDTTERKRAEEEKAGLQEQLAQAQKLESVGRLAGGVAHDFNNMLQAILGYTEMALEAVPPDQPLHADLVEVRKAAQRSTTLTRQLQTFARRQPVAPEALNLNEAVEAMLGMVRRLLGEDVHLEWAPGPDLDLVMLDHGQLDQIVVNLCINARDAAGTDGHIAIDTANLEVTAEEARRLPGLAPGPYIRLSVRDNGSGMTPQVRSRIFEPFFTTKPPGQGTGLGLATVYGIVTQGGGAIRVDSEPGKGTVFHI